MLLRILGRKDSWLGRAYRIHNILLRLGPRGTEPHAEVVARLEKLPAPEKRTNTGSGMRNLMLFLIDIDQKLAREKAGKNL